MYNLEQYLYGRKLHPELLSVLRTLSDMYGEDLQFISRDTKWVNFVVQGYVDGNLFHELEDNQLEIFGEDFEENPKFHIVRPMGRSSEKGVFLLHQSTSALQNEYRGGFWFY